MIKKSKKIFLSVCMLSFVVLFFIVFLFRFIPIPTTPYMVSERPISYTWISLDKVSTNVPLAIVAAEDANFCNHWGFDMKAIRLAIEQGGNRGASTISQQVVKNLFLWHERSWIRKFFEAILTPAVEIAWSKRRILEVYINIAEFDQGIFGIEEASQQLFGLPASQLSLSEASLLAAVLPNPKQRSVKNPSLFVQRRALAISDGASTILKDERSQCFTD
tara:strand:- start:76 stop:732 length:657 start_codon:yes stop_codon:yes gene_type:complete